MRARQPDAEGTVECNGVTTAYEVHGDGEPTLLLLPTWNIVHSRIWKMQVPEPHAGGLGDAPGGEAGIARIEEAAPGRIQDQLAGVAHAPSRS